MNERVYKDESCGAANAGAYLDGELDGAERARFEEHLEICMDCVALLNEQRRLLCALEATLRPGPAIELPVDFAKVVSTTARSDMRGLRMGSEPRQALQWCLLLMFGAGVFLGAAAGRNAVAPVIVFARRAVSFGAFTSHVFYDLGAAMAVILRAVGFHFFLEMRGVSVAILILTPALGAELACLMTRYHRIHSRTGNKSR